MKTRSEKNLQQSRTRPASLASKSRSRNTAVDNPLQRRVDDSAAMRRQRASIDKSFGHPLQRVEEEEMLQGKFAKQLQGDLEEEELMQGKFDGPVQKQGPEDEELLQGKFTTPLQREQEAAEPNQTGMPDNLKSGIESLSGMDISDVRVHYNSPKPAQLNAHAYAQGSDIHLGPGQEQHLPHEAWHTVQQREGRVQPTTQMADKKVNDDPGLEHEADVMGARALNKKNKKSG
jgi:hypothetical protein